ncbi:signal peptidase I [Spirochaetia bacterium]|nr:signal peptidase I [Spirochaetia bacterium]
MLYCLAMSTKQDRAEHPFFTKLQNLTESLLTRQRAVQRIKKEKQRAKNPLLDWVEAFIWAAAVVLLINQYLFQAYQIPSGSMIDTLIGGLRSQGISDDRIFVNKLIYGPELLPGVAKLPSPIKPEREDVIIFENPEYFSNGPLFDIAQRIIYMLTLSLVDIDRNETGEPRVHFLIKRAAGAGGDLIESREGEMYFRFAGEDRWVSEREYLTARGFTHNISRLITPEQYPALEARGKAQAYMELGLLPPGDLMERADAYTASKPDVVVWNQSRYSFIRSALPQDRRYREQLARQGLWYVPEGRILPLGDNRDNSQDGRFFGTVKLSKILGAGAIKYWPLRRMGQIK